MDINAVESIAYVFVMPILGLIGIFGNIVVLFVLLRCNLKDSSYMYLTAMTIFDVCVNVFAIGMAFVRCKPCDIDIELNTVLETFVILPGINIFATASLWTVLAMAVERFIFVAYPLKGKKYCQRRTAKLIIAIICLISVALNTPRFFIYRVTFTKISPVVDKACEDYLLVISICEAISFASLVYFNVRLIQLLSLNNKSRRKIVASFRNETYAAVQARDGTRLSITLSAVVGWAIFTNAFTLLASEPIGKLMYGTSFKKVDVYRVFILIGDFAVLASSSLNFVIYAIFNSRFKREFRRIYCSSPSSSKDLCNICWRWRSRPVKESTKSITRNAAIAIYTIDITSDRCF